ncbi:MAG: hypothetical protein ACO3JG_15915, partial [Luteolibacter sp.]
YLVQAGDAGNPLFFEVKPGAASGSSPGSHAASAGILIPAPPPGPAITLIQEDFGGAGVALNGTSADAFDAGITSAGGSSVWVADSGFRDNGSVSVTRRSAHLNLGSYINDAKGTANGKFELTMTISATTGSWISLGFSTLNAPATSNDFTQAAQSGLGTIIYRDTGELDMFIGPQTGGSTDGPDGNSGPRTLTVTLDLTPAGGYDGVTSFGTVTWTDSALGAVNNLGTGFALPNQPIGAILISAATGPPQGSVSALRLTQYNGGGTPGDPYGSWAAGPWSGTLTDDSPTLDFDGGGLETGIEWVVGGGPPRAPPPRLRQRTNLR